MEKAVHLLELRHLLYVIVAAEQGTFRGTSASIGVPVSTISRRIRDLEDEIGASLFTRHPTGVTLTFAGERFLGHARKALFHVNQAIREAEAAGTGHAGCVHIGLISSLASNFFNRLLNIYKAAYDNVRLVYSEGKTEDHLSAIQHDRLDVAFVISPCSFEGCEMVPLWEERVYVAMAESSALARQEEIAWQDLREQLFLVNKMPSGPEIFDFLVSHFLKFERVTPHIEQHEVSFDTLMQIVSCGAGVTLVSEGRTKVGFPKMAYRPLIGERFLFHAAWSIGNGNPAFRRFLSLAKVLSKSLTRNSMN